ncbi:MAG: hypothetical protein PHX70_13835, partial [Clostridium sp.]|nr:hypothetical protein [Clostridium sp.]
KKRNPNLYEMDSDPNPRHPCGNTVTKNAIYNSKAPDIAPAVIKYGNVSENKVISKADYTILKLYIYSSGYLKLKLPITDFKTIPLNKIGNYKDKYR